MVKKETIAAAAAAIALSGAAGAHEFVCEKTIEGEVVHVVESYPATLHFKVIVTNTHPTDASTALGVRDDALAKFLPAVPFTLGVGQSLELDAAITVRSRAECLRLSHAPACNGGIDDVFQVMFDGRLAQCAARLVCMRDDGGEGAGR
jgi:hypothetical protein